MNDSSLKTAEQISVVLLLLNDRQALNNEI